MRAERRTGRGNAGPAVPRRPRVRGRRWPALQVLWELRVARVARVLRPRARFRSVPQLPRQAWGRRPRGPSPLALPRLPPRSRCARQDRAPAFPRPPPPRARAQPQSQGCRACCRACCQLRCLVRMSGCSLAWSRSRCCGSAGRRLSTPIASHGEMRSSGVAEFNRQRRRVRTRVPAPARTLCAHGRGARRPADAPGQSPNPPATRRHPARWPGAGRFMARVASAGLRAGASGLLARRCRPPRAVQRTAPRRRPAAGA